MNRASDSPTVYDATRTFLDYCTDRGLTRQTVVDKKRTLDALVRAAGGDWPVTGLTRQHFNKAMDILKTGDNPEEAKARRLLNLPVRKARRLASLSIDKGTLKQFALYCRIEEWVAANFLPFIDIVSSSKTHADNNGQSTVRAKRSVPETDWFKLLEAASQQHARARAAVALAMYTGRRISELVTMTWGQFDLTDGSYWYIAKKVGKRQQFVLDLSGLEELQRWHQWMTDNYGPPRPADPVLPKKLDPREPWPDNDIRYRAHAGESQAWPLVPDQFCNRHAILRDIKIALRAIGWEDAELEGEGGHTLRRAHGRVVNAKKGLAAAQHSLGHSKMATTEGYLDTTEERERSATGFRGQRVFTSGQPVEQEPRVDEVAEPAAEATNIVDMQAWRRKAM